MSEPTPRAADHPERPSVIVGEETTARLGLSNGAPVIVRSPGGALPAILSVDPTQRNDVALIYRGGWAKLGHGVNTLTQSSVSQVGNGTPYYDTWVRIEPDSH